MPAEPPNPPSNPFSRPSVWPAASKAGLRITPTPDLKRPASAPPQPAPRPARASIITGSAIPGVAPIIKRAAAPDGPAPAAENTSGQATSGQAMSQTMGQGAMGQTVASQSAAERIAPDPAPPGETTTAPRPAPPFAAAPTASDASDASASSAFPRPTNRAPEGPVYVRKRKRRTRVRGVVAYGGGVALVVFAICLVISVIGRQAAIHDGVVARATSPVAPIVAPPADSVVPDVAVNAVETADGALRAPPAPRASVARITGTAHVARAAPRRRAAAPAQAPTSAAGSPLEELESSMPDPAAAPAPVQIPAPAPAQAAEPAPLQIPPAAP